PQPQASPEPAAGAPACRSRLLPRPPAARSPPAAAAEDGAGQDRLAGTHVGPGPAQAMRPGPEEALRLLAERERRLPRRLRRAAERLAYRGWRLLPFSSREVVRRLLIRTRAAPARPRPPLLERRPVRRTV